jgi:hypothetical protein
MPQSSANRLSHPVTAKRSWNLALLTPAEPKRRNRRTIDATALVLASLVTGLAAAFARSARDVDAELAETLTDLLGWAPSLWRAAFVLALAFAVLIAGDVALRRRWTLARDLLLAVVVVAIVGSILGRLVDMDWSQAEAHVFSNWGFPEFRLASAVAIFAVSGPELVRPARLLSFWVVGAAGLGAVVLGTGLPSQVLGAIALGLAAGALVRLALGSAAGVPPTERVRAALASLGVPEILVTFGSEGSLVFADGRLEPVPARTLPDGVDPTGAGDAFSAAYLVSRSAGYAPVPAARRASAVAADVLARTLS